MGTVAVYNYQLFVLMLAIYKRLHKIKEKQTANMEFKCYISPLAKNLLYSFLHLNCNLFYHIWNIQGSKSNQHRRFHILMQWFSTDVLWAMSKYAM